MVKLEHYFIELEVCFDNCFQRGLPGFNRVFKDMCVFEIREFRVPNDPYWTKSLHSDMLKEKGKHQHQGNMKLLLF